MHFDWFPRLFVGKRVRILGISLGLGITIPLKFLSSGGSNTSTTTSTVQSSSDKMGPQVLKGTHLAYHEPVFIVKKGLFSGSPVAAEFVTELPDNQVRVKEVASGKVVDVARDQVHLRYR